MEDKKSDKILPAMQNPTTPSMENPASENRVTNHIPRDLHFSVLSNLPFKSVNRFSSVHRSWYHLHENPAFLNMFLASESHYNDHPDVKLLFNTNMTLSPRLYLCSGEHFKIESELEMEFPSSFLNKNLSILGSAIHGVICLYEVSNQNNVIVWNPVNGQKHVLPTNHAENCISNVLVHGFGYDHVHQDFKVIQYVVNNGVKCLGSRDQSNSFWQVYSLVNNKHTKIEVAFSVPFLHYKPYDGMEVYLDNVCYWLGRISEDDQLYLVSFNLAKNKFLTNTPLDNKWVRYYDEYDFDVTELFLKLVVIHGSVAMIIQHTDPFSFSIYILGEIGMKETWTKLVNVSPLPSMKDSIAAGKKGVIFFKAYEKDGKVACYDLTTGAVEELNFGAGKNIRQIVLYKESDRSLSEKRKNTCLLEGINS
ncbi:putative F-box domain, galactose oxidase/kelch, beta-propeller, F-box associated interaction [Medicago truncatula]|nr:putative F-box domain, galactose oxidase/kelch, beta-propeller, F-box associated interaction [Medicago truncatula]